MRNCGCNKPGGIRRHDDIPPKEKEYFSKYSTLEKKIVLENLGLDNEKVLHVTNYPDEEDLTRDIGSKLEVLKFKDKEYNYKLFSGYGRVYLRKNIVRDEDGHEINALEPSMFLTKEGYDRKFTIFIIQYDYDLQGNVFSVPDNNILYFAGGSFNNGTLYLRGNTLLAPFGLDINKFIPCNILGNYADGQVMYKCGRLLFSKHNKLFDLSDRASIEWLVDAVNDILFKLGGVSRTSIHGDLLPPCDKVVYSNIKKYISNLSSNKKVLLFNRLNNLVMFSGLNMNLELYLPYRTLTDGEITDGSSYEHLVSPFIGKKYLFEMNLYYAGVEDSSDDSSDSSSDDLYYKVNIHNLSTSDSDTTLLDTVSLSPDGIQFVYIECKINNDGEIYWVINNSGSRTIIETEEDINNY